MLCYENKEKKIIILLLRKLFHWSVTSKKVSFGNFKQNMHISRYVKNRNSHQRCSSKKDVLRNFEACNFIEKETLPQELSCEFYEISKNTVFTEHLRMTATEDFWTNASMLQCSNFLCEIRDKAK